jgi:HPt (histidine-containing phosphotransfer) domain-containing protein
VQVTDTESILDREQLRDVTLNDPELMKEILKTLVDDTSLQLGRLEQAVREANMSQCARLAHYCKGACANVGARRAAAAMLHVERRALAGDIDECAASLAGLVHELELLAGEAARAVSG